MNKFKKIVVCSPGDVLISGGVNSLHNLCRALGQSGYDASMYYINPQEEIVGSSYYKAYGVKRLKEIEDTSDSLVIVPETLVPFLFEYKNVGKMIYWLSLPFYFKTPPWKAPFDIKLFRSLVKCKSYYGYSSGKIEDLKRRISEYAKSKLNIWDGSILHLSNSYLVADYCKSKGVEGYVLHNPIRDEFYDTSTVQQEREKIVLFGPKTQRSWMRKASRKLPEFQFIKLKRMPSDQVFELMSKAMAFIEIGKFPGRDRMPREAAMRGCVVITNTRGTAGNDKDFKLTEDYRIVETKRKEIVRMIEDVATNYEKHYQKQAGFREELIEEKNNFRLKSEQIFDFFVER